ncbi:unnamed protein product [Calypogeia fissa]
MDLCRMSLMEVEDFLDDKRTHMAEGIIVVEQDKSVGYGKSVRMSKEAVSVLLRRPLKTEQRLKFSKTELLNVLETSEANSSENDVKKTSKVQGDLVRDPKPKPLDENDLAVRDVAAHVGELDELLKSSRKPEQKLEAPLDDTASSEVVSTSEVGMANGTVSVIDRQCGVADSLKEEEKDGELSVYKSSLEYLDDSFQELALKLQIAKARHKEDMKEALNDERPWYDRSSKVSNLRELMAKLRFAQNRLIERMKLTEKACEDGSAQLPRLEALAKKLGLDEFEKGVVIMLAGISISPVLKSIFEAVGTGKYRPSSDNIQVKDVLIVFFDSFKEQVLARTYFYKSSKLVARGLIKLRASLYARGGGGDLMEQHVELDRRILDWIVGLDAEMNELVDGSHLYQPKISMEHVVLPEEQKDMLLKTVDNFANFKKFRKSAGLEDLINYGAGLVVLLCGPSGTGKTMTVNAVAHHLGKRVLLVDFQSLHKGSGGSRTGDDQSADLRGLFRDAEMNDAIIFFDECESIFAKRERGGDKLLSSLLTEMERHEGIIMLATNRPLDLDEAMHRRITCVSEFSPPDHTQRRAIWKLASERLPVADEVNWDEIALRYELTGGYIKNALVGALLTAISRDSEKPTVTEADIVDGCRLQMRGSLQMKTFKHRVVPKTGLDKLILTPSMRQKLEAIVTFQKARGVLLGQWGFELERIGTGCLFWGPSGTGKSSAAEAIGYELGRPLKVINCGQLISKDKKNVAGSNITSAFRDSQLMDAVLVLDDFQILWGQAIAGVGSVSAWSDVAIGLLLHELSKFPGICILVANNVQGSVVHRIDPELTRRLKFLVEFKMPESVVRAQMWKKMIPEKCPLSPGINFEELGRRFEFTSKSISSAIVRGAAKASLRTVKDNVLTYEDLIEAAEAEQAHFRDEISEFLLSAYI